MLRPIKAYFEWLHTGWPAGTVEKLPRVGEDGATDVPGVYIAGDLAGIPLLKFSSDTGARVVRTIVADEAFASRDTSNREVFDLVIVGAGVAGIAAAIEARQHDLRVVVLEASEIFSTIVNFPKHKPIYTYPSDMAPAGALQFSPTADIKERLLDELRACADEHGIAPRNVRVREIRRHGGRRGKLLEVVSDGEPVVAHRVIVAIGRSGNFRRLDIPGEDLDKVHNRLHDPAAYAGKDLLIIGGGDSAAEAAIATTEAGARVILSYRQAELGRPKPDIVARLYDLEAAGRLRLALATEAKEIRPTEVVLRHAGAGDEEETIDNQAVLTSIGREAPLDFLRRSNIPITGEWRAASIASFAAFVAFCVFLYNWKAGGWLTGVFKDAHLFPFNLQDALASWLADPTSLAATLALTLQKPGFYYSLAYCACVVGFGIARIRRRRTPYVAWQTGTLMAFQLVPLFLLPYILLPWAGHNGWFDTGIGKSVADALFPLTEWDAHGREYWRAFAFVLAWPLFVWNFFTHEPMWAWLVIGGLQTFVAIPLLVYFWGKGAYCGWICSCGALAETLGDTHRHKMPHGRFWNRLNGLGQVILGLASLLLLTRIAGWIWPDSAVAALHAGLLNGFSVAGVQLNYYWLVDVLLAGIIGVGFYFWFSGRVWCRFACPLAALMHIYARLGRFRIVAEKKKCISCNVCTSVCHQGIDVMSFANRGLPMADPECVRCSACVESCPTGVLRFGQVNPSTGAMIKLDTLVASAVRAAEARVN